jgi:cell division protein FtsB
VYSAEVRVDAGVPLQAHSRRFVILPLVVVIPAGILLLLLLVGIWRVRRMKKRRARRAAAVEAIKAKELEEESTVKTINDQESPVDASAPSNLQQSPEEE